MCGGFNGSLRVRTVDVYDTVKDVWTTVQPMEARRSTLGAAVLDGMVYAVGGFDGSTGKLMLALHRICNCNGCLGRQLNFNSEWSAT